MSIRMDDLLKQKNIPPPAKSTPMNEIIGVSVEKLKDLFTATGKTIIGQPEAVKDTAQSLDQASSAAIGIPLSEATQNIARNVRHPLDFVKEVAQKPAMGEEELFNMTALHNIQSGTGRIGTTNVPKKSPDARLRQAVETAEGKVRVPVEKEIPIYDGSGNVTKTIKTSNVPTAEEIFKKAKQSKNRTPAEKVFEPELDFKERKFIKTIRESPLTAPEVASRIEGQYLPKSNDVLSLRARQMIAQDPLKAAQIARSGVDDQAVATGMELISHLQKQGNYEAAIQLVEDIAPKLTEHGRAIQAASMYNRLTPVGIQRYAQKKLNDAGIKIKPEQAKMLAEEAAKVQGMPDNIEKVRKGAEVMGKIDDLIPDSLLRRGVSLWKAGLLTGIKTTGVNTYSNAIHGIMEQANKIGAAGIDSVISLYTKKRTVGMPSPTAYVKGMREGFDKGVRFFKTGFDERNLLNKYDFKKTNYGTGPIAKVLRKYEQTVFRLMGAEDQPFYYAAKAASINEQASAIVKNARMRGAKLIGKNIGGKRLSDKVLKRSQKLTEEQSKNLFNELVAMPTDEMLKNAVIDAETSVFQNNTRIGTFLGGARKAFGPAGEIAVPFAKTPSAVFMQGVNYTPVGLPGTIVNNIKKGKFDQRQFSLGLSRNLIGGSGLVAIGAALYKSGKMTLNYPKNEKERRQWELEGKQANSILWDGKYRRIEALGPVGIALLTGGHYAKGYDDTGSKAGALMQTLAGMGRSAIDSTALAGVSIIQKTLEDPERSGGLFVQNLAGSLVPTIVGDAAKANDPNQRVVRDKASVVDSSLSAIKSRVPGLRKSLPKAVNVLGEPTPRPTTAIMTMLDPLRSSTERGKSDKVIQELKRLSKNEDTLATPTAIRQKHEMLDVEFIIPNEELSKMQIKAGTDIKRTYEKFMSDPLYKQLNDTEKAEFLNRISGDIKRVNTVKYGQRSGKLSPAQAEFILGTLGKESDTLTPSQLYYYTGVYITSLTGLVSKSKQLKNMIK